MPPLIRYDLEVVDDEVAVEGVDEPIDDEPCPADVYDPLMAHCRYTDCGHRRESSLRREAGFVA